MPNRIIRESALISDTLTVLSDAEERLWWRMILVADDHGRFDATPDSLASRCFPKNRRLPSSLVELWLQWITRTGAIALYEVNGHQYGVFVNWSSHQRTRESKPKHPAPPEEALAEAQTRAAALTTFLRQPAATCREWRRIAATCGNLPPSRRYGVVAVGMESGVVAGAVPAREAAASGGVQRTPSGYDVPPADLERWKVNFPGVDVVRELGAAFEWEAADSKRRKIRLKPFLVSWLKRAQDHGPARRAPPNERLEDRARRYTEAVRGVVPDGGRA